MFVNGTVGSRCSAQLSFGRVIKSLLVKAFFCAQNKQNEKFRMHIAQHMSYIRFSRPYVFIYSLTFLFHLVTFVCM